MAALALAIDRVLQRKVAEAGLDLLSTRAVWAALETVSLVEFELPGGQRKAGVCVNGKQGSEAYQVLQALGANLEAPRAPESGDSTIHWSAGEDAAKP